MELNEFKEAWQRADPGNKSGVNGGSKSDAEIDALKSVRQHPILRRIRNQLMIEMGAWIVFAALYYTALDGEKKPVWVNALLLAAFACSIVHHAIGYSLFDSTGKDASVADSLSGYLQRIRRYSVISLLSRIGFMSGLLIFLTYGIHFTPSKYGLLAVILSVFAGQLIVVHQVWRQRIQKIETDLVEIR